MNNKALLKRKIFAILFLSVLFLSFGIFSVSAQELPIILIVNYTGYNIYGVFISSSDSEELGDNILEDFEGEILGVNEAVEVLLHNPLSVVNTYDIFLLAEDSSWFVKMGLELSGDARIVFTYDDLL